MNIIIINYSKWNMWNITIFHVCIIVFFGIDNCLFHSFSFLQISHINPRLFTNCHNLLSRCSRPSKFIFEETSCGDSRFLIVLLSSMPGGCITHLLFTLIFGDCLYVSLRWILFGLLVFLLALLPHFGGRRSLVAYSLLSFLTYRLQKYRILGWK